ncbi:hypothetical protein [Halalkalibacter hemicellulosilyticus]|uniref:Uncharacterized protein n=1 Tax=Halalkalibacter hemicellulosilyticusJCM 9152 TaxID=1236971 RepID=W4QLN1_9BACI|nr:hypothetical protein [Halalkalibacter hemicellulosilyticus]GAE32986.1 hypothetical protein JCM9152_4586 [Halalkalibacter hemicellulosilyticusJCM 9152]
MNKVANHVINILLGVITIGFSLFFTWGVMAFGPEGNMIMLALPFVVSLIWSVVYYLQVKFNSVKNFILLLFVELTLFYIILSLIDLN